MPVGLMSNDGMNVVGNNLTSDNTSPWITYTGIWNFAVMGIYDNMTPEERNATYGAASSVPGHDAMMPYYWNSTYTATTNDGDYITFSWTGGDIYLYGGKRLNHNYYSVSLDGGEKEHYNGYSISEQIDELLFLSKNLGQGEHTIKVTNEVQYGTPDPMRRYLDLDYILVDGVPKGMDTAQAEQMRLASISSYGGTTATSASARPTRASTIPASRTTESSSSHGADSMGIVTDLNQPPRIDTTLPAVNTPAHILDGSASSSIASSFGLCSLLSLTWTLWFIHKSMWP